MSYAKKRQLLIDFCDQFGHIIIKKIDPVKPEERQWNRSEETKNFDRISRKTG